MTLVTILISNAESHCDWCYCSLAVARSYVLTLCVLCNNTECVCWAFDVASLFPSLCVPLYTSQPNIYLWYCSFSRFFLRARSHVPSYALYNNVLPKRFLCARVFVCAWVCVYMPVLCPCFFCRCVCECLCVSVFTESGELEFLSCDDFFECSLHSLVFAEIVRCVVCCCCLLLLATRAAS